MLALGAAVSMAVGAVVTLGTVTYLEINAAVPLDGIYAVAPFAADGRRRHAGLGAPRLREDGGAGNDRSPLTKATDDGGDCPSGRLAAVVVHCRN